MRRRKLLAVGFVLGPLAAGGMRLHGQAAKAQSAVLVELFTSEGCSSCPPADALLAKVNGQWIDPNVMIVGISEHVTYWNSLGWVDPFSQDSFTERQNGYGNRFGLDSVYTPQMVVNGDAQFVGSDESALKRALRNHTQASPVRVHVASMTPRPDGLKIACSLTGELPRDGVEVWAVVADDMQRSSVARGENSGRTLTHVSVARTLTRIARVKETGALNATVALGKSAGPRHLIVFVQEPHAGKILATESQAIAAMAGSGAERNKVTLAAAR